MNQGELISPLQRSAALSTGGPTLERRVLQRIHDHQIQIALHRRLEPIIQQKYIDLLAFEHCGRGDISVGMDRDSGLATGSCQPGGLISAQRAEVIRGTGVDSIVKTSLPWHIAVVGC
jgi:hypothetical protein